MIIMKAIFLGLLFCGTYCFAQDKNPSGSEYTLKEFTTVSSGTESPQNTKLLIICYNKHFNKDKFKSDFIKSNRLDQINYKQNMAVEIFLGQVKEKVVNLKVDKIEESNTIINVYYSFEISKSTEAINKSTPYLIVETPKSEKMVVFYENGAALKMPGYSAYVDK